MTKSAEEILDAYYETGMHWRSSNRYNILKAMQEYANQFKAQSLPVGGYREAEQWKKFAEWTASEYWFYYTNLKVWQKSFDDGIHDKFTTEQLYNLFASPNQEQGEKQEQNPG